jgi:stage II sporulation protein M
MTLWTVSLALAIGLFLVSFALGMAAPPAASSGLMEETLQFLGPLARLGPLELVAVIFLNNALKALGTIVLGIAFGIPSVLFITINGYLLGVVVGRLAPSLGYGGLLASLLPHGLIEVPAVIVATALGLAIGAQTLRWAMGRQSQVKHQFRTGLRVYVKWLLPALLLAALIEAFITPFVAAFFALRGLISPFGP